MNNRVVDTITLPNEVMNGLTDFTITLWVNIE